MNWIPAMIAIIAVVTPVATARQGTDGGGGEGGPPPAAVRVAAVEEQTLQERRRITGELRAVARSQVATMEEGVALDVLVQEGDDVVAGQPLARLDSRRLELELANLEAQIDVATAVAAAREAEFSLAERDVQVLEALEARAASNPKELADRRSQLAVAAANRDEARRRVTATQALADLHRTRLDDMVIKSPFDGVVVAVLTERGEWVDKGAAIAEIVATGRYEAWLDVPQRYAPWLFASDATVLVQVEGMDAPSPAAAPHAIRLVDPRARTFPVYVVIEDPDGHFAPGMSAVGWVPTGGRAAHLTVPRDAIMRNQAGDFVYAVRPTGAGRGLAAPVPVTVLFEAPDVVVVRGDLATGDLVIVEGNERLFPMNPVSFHAPGDA